MKVRYEFANGEVSVVEVSEDIGEMIMSSRREEESALRQQRRYCCSMEDMDYEGEYFADYRTPEEEFIDSVKRKQVADAFNQLTPTQQRRLSMLADGMSVREIAKTEEADFKSVWESLESAKKKFKKNF